MILKAILLSMMVASVSFFITHSQLTLRYRDWLLKRSEILGDLFGCCYCLGHWITIVALLLFPVRLFGIFLPADYLLTWLVISWMAGLQSLAASRLWGE